MEEKIYEILIEVQKDVKDLKSGQNRLEKGQARLEERQTNLEKMQVKLEERQKNLEKMQVKLEERQINLEANQEIMKNNISKILEEQINFNEKFKDHLKEANILYKGIDYRVTLLEA